MADSCDSAEAMDEIVRNSQDMHWLMRLPYGMQRRRGQSDPFLKSRQPQWLVVSTVGGEIVSVKRLAPGTNLEQEFLNTIDCQRSEGWIIENDPHYPCVFAHRNGERRMVTLCHVDPVAEPLRHFSPWQN